MRRLFRLTAALLILVPCTALLVLAGLHAFLMTDAGEQAFFRALNSLIPGTISAREASVSLLGGEADLLDGRLRGPDGGEIIRAERLKVGINPAALLVKRVELRITGVEKPRISLALSPDRRLNIVAAFVDKKEEAGLGIGFAIDDLDAREGLVTYDDPEGPFSVRFQGVALKGSVDFEEPWVRADASAERVEITAGTRKTGLGLNRAKVSASLVRDRIEAFSLEFRTGDHLLSCSGSLEDILGRPCVDMTFATSGDLRDIAVLFGQEGLFSGQVTSRMTARGPLDDPECALDLRYAGGRLGGVPVQRLAASLGLKARVLTVARAEAGLAQGSVAAAGVVDLRRVFPGTLFSGRQDPGLAAYGLSLRGQGLDLTGIMPGLKGLPEDLSGEISMTGTGLVLPDISAKAGYSFVLKGFGHGSPVPGDSVAVRGTADLDYPVLELSTTAAAGRGLSARVRGWIDVASTKLGAQVSVKMAQAGKALPAPFRDLSGSFEAGADISGSLKNPVISASMTGRDVFWKGAPLGAVEAEASLGRDGMLRLGRFTTRNGVAEISAKGGVRLFRKGFRLDPDLPLNLDAVLLRTDFGRLPGRYGLNGDLRGGLRVAGSLYNPTASMDFSGGHWSFREWVIGDLRMQGGFRNGTLSIERLDLVNRGSRLKVSGEVDILDPRRRRVRGDPGIRLQADGDDLDLRDFTSRASGRMNLRADIRGSVKSPEGGIRVQGAGLLVRGQEIRSLDLSSSLADRSFTIDSLEIEVVQGQKIAGTGSIALHDGNGYELSLSTRGIDLDAFRVLKKTPVTDGRLVFDISGRGSISDPRLKGSVLIQDPGVNHERLQDVFMNVDLKGRTLSVLGESSFGFTAACDLGTGDLDLRALFRRTELRPYFSILGREDLHGLITGDARMRGNVLALEDMDLAASVSDLNIFFYEESLVSGHDIHVSYRDRALVIPRTRVKLLKEGSLAFQTRGAGKGRLDLQAEGRLPLEILGAFDPGLSGMTGNLLFTAEAEGPLMTPVVTGDMTFDGLSAPITYNGQLLHGVKGHVRLTKDDILIEDLDGNLDSGSFSVSGRIGLKDLSPVTVALNASARSLPVVIPDSMNLTLDARTTLRGTPDDTRLRGNVVIRDGTYYKDVQVNLIAEVGEMLTGAAPPQEADRRPFDQPFLRNMKLDVAVTRQGNLVIGNNLADAAINPDLNIRGTLNDPVVTGRVSVIQGTVTYQKRAFDITRGVVEFPDPYRTDPRVEVKAQGKVRDWTITVAVSGPLNDLKVDLSSQPAADNATIISLLATGKTPEEITGRSGESQTNPSALLAQLVADTYGEDVKRTAGIDILEFEAGTSGNGSQAQDLRITVGEKLSRRLTVKYTVETSGNEITRTSVAEYKLLENLLLNGFQDSNGLFGGDVQIKLEFR